MAVHVVGPVVMTEALRGPLGRGPGGAGEQWRDVRPAAAGRRPGLHDRRLLADDVVRPFEALAGGDGAAPGRAVGADDITVATMHPGWADTPGVQESLPRFRAITRPVLRDDAQGADTSVWLAAVDPAPPTGLFWHDRVARPTSLLPSTRPSEADMARRGRG